MFISPVVFRKDNQQEEYATIRGSSEEILTNDKFETKKITKAQMWQKLNENVKNQILHHQ